jgi:oligoendopeptidase F
MGALEVNLDGETLTIPEAKRKLLDPDRSLRERAWHAIQNANLSVSGELDALFLNSEVARWIAENAGFSTTALPLARFNRFDYTRDSASFTTPSRRRWCRSRQAA